MKTTCSMTKSVIAAVGLSLLLSACGDSAPLPEPVKVSEKQFQHRNYGNSLGVQTNVDSLFAFINVQLADSNGFYTNRIDTSQDGELTTGHELLSESAGLMMRYAVLSDQQALFHSEWEKAQRIFNMETAFSYRYSPKNQKRYDVNAAVDDLRLIRALYEASNRFGSGLYQKDAERYGARFYEFNVKDGYLYDFFDEKHRVTNDFITLCYIDLSTLSLLPAPTGEKQKLIDNMVQVIEEGYLSNAFPFYETRYHYSTDGYQTEMVNSVESLLTILHLAEIGRHKPESIALLKDKVAAGHLYGQYTKDGIPTNDIRSTALYALSAMIGAEIGDKDLYKESIARMSEFQIDDEASSMYGGFGDPNTMQAYSFDNLMALLAYSY